MPVEHLWQWLREDVTYHTCFQKKRIWLSKSLSFKPKSIKRPWRLLTVYGWKSLEPTEEKLRVSSWIGFAK
jgi:hypothetical protein